MNKRKPVNKWIGLISFLFIIWSILFSAQVTWAKGEQPLRDYIDNYFLKQYCEDIKPFGEDIINCN